MTKLEIAAQTWAKLEAVLSASALPDDRLTAERSRCIAIIAEALGAKKTKLPAPQKNAPEPVPLPLIEFPQNIVRGPRPLDSPQLYARGPSSSLESAITRRLDQIIDQATTRKVRGYGGDDEVDH